MKMPCVVLGVLLLGASAHATAGQDRMTAARGTLSAIAWLAGNWQSDPARPAIVEERWTPAAGGAMLAVARTVKGDRMVGFEFLRIVERAGGLVYIAQPEGRPPTEFVMTSVSRNQVTFENPAHDFPKVIRYTLKDNGTLEAEVGDGAQEKQTFVFARRD